MSLKTFIKKRPHLVWHVKDLDNLSQESVVENVLNYGDFDDIKKMFKIIGLKNTANIFKQQIKQLRNNYDPKIAHYFKLYFQKHAHTRFN